MDLHNSLTYLRDLDAVAERIVHREDLYGKSVLITGATGTVGSYLADVLLRMNQSMDAKIKVILAGRRIEALKALYADFGKEYVEFVPYDMRAEITFDVPVDYVIHAAGNAHPAAFNADPVGTVVDTVNALKGLLDYAASHGAGRLLYVSSGEVYGVGLENEDSYQENRLGQLDLSSPRSCYPESKRMAENLCACYTGQFGLETVSVRLCHTYGPMMTATDNRAHAQFIQKALAGQDIELKSAGLQLRSYNYAADAAGAILSVLLAGTSGESYNIANPTSVVTIARLAQIIAEASGNKVIFADPSDADLANRSPISKQVLDTGKLESLGWSGIFTVESGVEHTIRCIQEGQK